MLARLRSQLTVSHLQSHDRLLRGNRSLHFTLTNKPWSVSIRGISPVRSDEWKTSRERRARGPRARTPWRADVTFKAKVFNSCAFNCFVVGRGVFFFPPPELKLNWTIQQSSSETANHPFCTIASAKCERCKKKKNLQKIKYWFQFRGSTACYHQRALRSVVFSFLLSLSWDLSPLLNRGERER